MDLHLASRVIKMSHQGTRARRSRDASSINSVAGGILFQPRGIPARGINSEHTHLWQIGSFGISNRCRNSIALRSFRIRMRGCSRRLPMGGWKKQGWTEPSESMTAETQGALQTGDIG